MHKVSSLMLAAFMGLATCLPASAQPSINSSSTPVILTPFFDLTLSLQPPDFTSDYSGRLALFHQVEPAGTATGSINRTLPAIGNLQLQYPSAEEGTAAYGSGIFLLNTTTGEGLRIKVEGPITTSGQDSSATGLLFTSIQTHAQDLLELNQKSLIFDFYGKETNGVQSGGGSVYEVNK